MVRHCPATPQHAARLWHRLRGRFFDGSAELCAGLDGRGGGHETFDLD
jgi:hypothetical protein